MKKILTAVAATVAALSISACAAAAASAPHQTRAPRSGDGRTSKPDPRTLQTALDDVHRAGVPGVVAEVRRGGRTWRGASGVADLASGRPMTTDLRQRVGSLTKTFTAAAVLQLVEQRKVGLDVPIGRYLPDLVPGERGRTITVRMLLNHSSGLGDYLYYAFPSLADRSPQSLDDNRFRQFAPAELIELGLNAPATGEPGGPQGVYSNTNYLLLGQLIEKITGTPAERYITRHVIDRAGLRHTEFPTGPRINGPHPRMYEGLHGLINPPRDYSVYNMSWVGPAASLVSTVADIDRFYAHLLAGRIVKPSSLAQMQQTIPVLNQEGEMIDYGLGLHKVTLPGCGTFWGHDGTVWGAFTISLIRTDGQRQLTVTTNLVRWDQLDSSGKPQPHPIDDALSALYRQSVCDS